MAPMVGTAPCHRALEVLERLVRLFDANFIAKQYVRSSGQTELLALERDARAIIGTPPKPVPTPRDEAWCPKCHARHVLIEDRRLGARA